VRDESIASPNEDNFPSTWGGSTPQGCDQQAVASPQGGDHASSLVAEPGLGRDLSRPPL